MPLLCPDQRSPEWYAARRGKITASTAAAILGVCPYMGPLAAFNKITGRTETPDNYHMQRGRENEPHARVAYEVQTGNLVWESGLWQHPQHEWLAASPDGLVGDDGLLEIKCPAEAVAEVCQAHTIQIAVQLACTDRQWADYFAFGHWGTFRRRLVRWPDGERLMIAELEAFFRRFVEIDCPPPRRRTLTSQ